MQQKKLSLEIDFEFCLKGEIEEVEQYGAFCEIEVSSDNFPEKKYYFDSIVTANYNTEFVVCGIAGDYCVKSTIQNMLDNEITPKVYCPGIVSIDGGKIFSDFVKENKLEKIV